MDLQLSNHLFFFAGSLKHSLGMAARLLKWVKSLGLPEKYARSLPKAGAEMLTSQPFRGQARVRSPNTRGDPSDGGKLGLRRMTHARSLEFYPDYDSKLDPEFDQTFLFTGGHTGWRVRSWR